MILNSTSRKADLKANAGRSMRGYLSEFNLEFIQISYVEPMLN